MEPQKRHVRLSVIFFLFLYGNLKHPSTGLKVINMLYGFQEAVSKPTSPDATKLTDQENGNDVV
jgi:hypothetical protein